MFHKKKYDYDLIIIGSGAGGSVGAHYAQSLGKKVALFEKGAIGGECPNFACVPTKALLHTAEVYTLAKESKALGIEIPQVSLNFHAVNRWRELVVSRTGAAHGAESFRKEGLTLIREHARFLSPHEVSAGGKVYSAAKFIIATGSRVFIPPITGLEDVGYLTFKEALALREPPKSLMIFGAGAVGCEFSQIFSTFGTKVTLVNRSKQILGKEDREVRELVEALFANQGITVLTDISVVKVEKHGKKKIVHFQKKDKEYFKEFDDILIATGKIPEINFDPEKAGIALHKSRIHVNRFMQTNVSHIYAAGDIVGPYLFTHTGYDQSYLAAHNAFSHTKLAADYRVVPRCVFLTPEVASVGITEEEAYENGIPIKKGITAIGVLGRANTSNAFDGFVKVITDKNDFIIGASIVAPRAGEMIHEIALAIKCRVKSATLATMVHAYPTYSEAIKIACSSVV